MHTQQGLADMNINVPDFDLLRSPIVMLLFWPFVYGSKETMLLKYLITKCQNSKYPASQTVTLYAHM